MPGMKELKISLTMDNGDLLRKTAQAEAAQKHMTDSAASGMTKISGEEAKAADGMRQYGKEADKATATATQGMQETKAATQKTDRSVANLIKTQFGMQAVKSTADAVVRQFNEASVRIEGMAKAFQKLRADMNSVASLSGQQNTTKFALKEIDRAQAANVLPEEAKDFRDAFLAKASLYVGEGAEAKMSTEEADKFQAALMEYAKQKGVSQQEMAGFAGGLLAQQKGKTNAKDMIARAGRTFATLEASSAPVGHLLPMMTRTMAGGMSAEDASASLAMMPEIAPEEEGTYLSRAVQTARELVLADRGAEFGINAGASQRDQLRALVGNLQDRQRNGENLDSVLKDIAPEHVAQQALRGMVGQGREGFDRWRGITNSTPDNVMQTTIEAGRRTETGRQAAVDAALAAEQARLGARNDALARRRQIAEVELTRAGHFEHTGIGERISAAVTDTLGGDDLRTQQTNRQLIRRARAELGESSGLGDTAASLSRGSTDELMRTLIARIEAQTEVIKDGQKPNGGVPAPIANKPAVAAPRP